MFGKNILSLSIAGTTVRALSARGDSVVRWDSVPFPTHFIKKGCVADPVALGGLLKDALAERKLNKGKVVCALSAVGATSRVFSLPKVDARQLETIISREARRLSDNSVEKSFVHWRTLPSSDGQLHVYLLIVPKRPLHALVKTIKSAGLKASLIDLKSMALIRAVNRRNAIIANGEENCVDMTIVRHDLPMVVRSVFFGNGMPSSDQAANRIADEVMQTLSAYMDSHRDKPLPQQVPVFLTGAAAGGAAAMLNVTTLTGHPIANIQPPLRYPDDLPLAEYAVNMGLILRML